MARPKKTPEEPTKTVSADDFLAELEATEDALTLDEEDEIVTEADILAELGDAADAPSPVATESAPAPQADLSELFTAITSISDSINERDRELGDHLNAVEKRLTEKQDAVAKAIGTLIAPLISQVAALTEAVKGLEAKIGTAPAPPAPAKKADADAFVAKAAPKPEGVVDAYMLKEVRAIVTGLPAAFVCEVSRLAKVIHAKRFAGDPAALPKIEALCRDHISDLGEIKNGVFTRFGKSDDISL